MPSSSPASLSPLKTDDPSLDDLRALEADVSRELDPQTFDVLASRLAAIPEEIAVERPKLLRLRAHLLRTARDEQAALATSELACQLAVRQQDWPTAARCALDQARWHQHKEGFEPALAALSRAERYVEFSSSDEPSLEAELSLAIGWLWPDLGRNDLSIEWATRALQLFERIGDLHGQVEALWVLSVVYTYQARLFEAVSLLERALRLHELTGFGALRRLFLLNVRAHIALYAGDIETGLRVVRVDTAPHVAQLPHSKPALYLAMAEAALACQSRDWTGALAALERADAIIHASNDVGFLPWVVMERGWIRVLAGSNVASVRRELVAGINPQNRATLRRFTMQMAILDILEGRLEDAEARLQVALEQYRQAGEPFADFSIHVYLAYVYLRKGAALASRREIDQALGWAEEMSIDGFPYLWHDRLVADVCVEALRSGVRPRQAEMMILRRLGDAALPGLMALVQEQAPEIRQRARSVLGALGGDRWLHSLEELPEHGLREVLMAHFSHGRLALSRLDVLSQRLQPDAVEPDWQRFGVFGFYAASDLSRREIASELSLSESAVKKHIGAIRAAFGVASRGGRDERREWIQEQARLEGFVL